MNLTKNGMFEREYFDKYYSNYSKQNPPKKMAFYRALMEDKAKGVRCPRVLDLGCAFGRFLSTLDPNWDRYGQDVSEFAIDQARQSVPGVRFSVSNIMEIPFEGFFDIIVCFDVLEHVHDLETVAHTVQAKLTPEGFFIFVVPVYDGPASPFIYLLDRDNTHVHKKSRNFWLAWANLNFSLDQWWGIFRYLLPWGYYLHRPTMVLRRVAPAISIVTRNRRMD